MRFQVGKFICEMTIDNDGNVEARWFLANGRRTEAPKYLAARERRQYRAGREAFLRHAGKAPARLGSPLSPGASWRTLRRIAPVLAVAVGLTGCARGGGIGLEAMMADHNCEAAGYQPGTPQYAQCRMELSRQSAMNAAVAQAQFQRQEDWYWQQQNRRQFCSYNGSNIGGITGGTVQCW